MSPPPGWYPDPGGPPGALRWWDGRAWTAATRPGTAPQPAGPAVPAAPVARRPNRWPWLLGLAAVLIALVVAIVLVVVTSTRPPDPSPGPGDPTPSATVCPEAVQPSAGATPDLRGDRVVSGRLSYPRLVAPFSAPTWDRRVPFGRDVRNQQAPVESDANGQPSWVASVIIARLLAGDGFYGPQQGAAVVAGCITDVFYGGAQVERKDLRNQATTVDGHPGWIIVAHLGFDLPDVETKGETMTVVVVDTAEGEAGLFYTSNPDTSPQLAEPLSRAQAGLRVS